MVRTPPAAFVDIGHHACFTAEYNFSVVLEVDLHYLVRESEHDRMLGAHPLLDLDWAVGRWRGVLFLVIWYTF